MDNALTRPDVRKTYSGTKTLYAWPATKVQYNNYRGWVTPSDEDPLEPGYLVEYTNGGEQDKPNHPNHAGYISWSPAGVFESTYHEVSTDWRDRVQQEGVELRAKITKLEAFLANDGGTVQQRELLTVQLGYMEGYAKVLAQRLL